LKRKILIVDDEPDVLTYLRTFLEDQSFGVSCAQDVPSALQKITEEKPDLICLDIMMPIKSGISFYEHIRREESLQEIPVIIISGMNMESMANFLPAGEGKGGSLKSYRFLNKPVDLNQFLEVIREVLPVRETDR
jgi:CheY-like chemotaxis protein